jgi:hypothetical protein
MLKNLLTTYDFKSVGTPGGVWDAWRGCGTPGGVWDAWRGCGTPGGGVERLVRVEFSGHKKSRGILEGESPRQLKLQRPV